MSSLAVTALLVVSASDPSNAWLGRRGAVPIGLSLSAGLGVTERVDGVPVAAFTQYVALSLDLPRRFVAQLGVRIARGGSPAFIFVNGTTHYRFVFTDSQRVIPSVGLGVVVGAISLPGGGSLLVAGLGPEVGVEFKLFSFLGLWIHAGLALEFPTPFVLPHQTAGLTLSL